jgi:hypothetical protein
MPEEEPVAESVEVAAETVTEEPAPIPEEESVSEPEGEESS